MMTIVPYLPSDLSVCDRLTGGLGIGLPTDSDSTYTLYR